MQKRLLALAGSLARPSITATQMLDSMVTLVAPDARRGRRRRQRDPRRHRRGDALPGDRDRRAPGRGGRDDGGDRRARPRRPRPTSAGTESACAATRATPPTRVAHSACEAARELGLDALVVPTLSGRSARLVSAHRPEVPIYALSPGRETVRRCGLMWGVRAASMRRHEVTEELIADAARRVVELGWCQPGERVGITAGLPSGRPGTTSLFQVQTVVNARRRRCRPIAIAPPAAPTATIASRRAEVAERAAERDVGERARRAADRGRQREGDAAARASGRPRS